MEENDLKDSNRDPEVEPRTKRRVILRKQDWAIIKGTSARGLKDCYGPATVASTLWN